MAPAAPPRPRVRVDGKFFRLGDKKFYVKGLTYGPFAKNGGGEHFASPEQTRRDFAQMRELGANVARVYHVPPRWFLELAAEFEVKLLVDVPWNKRVCFLDQEGSRQAARRAVREAAVACAGHPAVFALSVVNEIPPEVVRWSGAPAVAEFLDELVRIAKEIDPECLCTFASFPPTEYLQPASIDFHCYNVFLHHQKPFENYLSRLQVIADSKPLILGECGIDTQREGEAAQAEMLRWQIETSFRSGLAGMIVYSFTDDWFCGGQQIENWSFGVTRRDRQPKPAFEVVQKNFHEAPYYPLPYQPLVSVVVAVYNGARTLKACLESLERLNYSRYEIIVVDDGSTDTTPQIAAVFKTLRYIRYEENQGLSVARNTGIEVARGEIVAFTDADCRADEDWLYYLVGDLLHSKFTGIGGHNFLPPEDSWVPAAVMVSPGGPAHVMLTDRLAEHIPGCNMAFYKWAIEEAGGFDPIFRLAGDDVDICWRLQQLGYKIGFSHAGFVWHYRRASVQAYLGQQRGYGQAEAMLVRKHPEYFSALGGGIWQGRIYTPAKSGIVIGTPMIYHGLFGSAFFQSLYQPPASFSVMLLTSLEYHALVTLPLFVFSAVFPNLLPVAIVSLMASLSVCVAAAVQADLPRLNRKPWSRPLVAILFFLQPIVRGWARYGGRIKANQPPLSKHETLDTLDLKHQGKRFDRLHYWANQPPARLSFLTNVMERLDRKGWQSKTDGGWNQFDIEIYGSRWSNLQLLTAAEQHSGEQELIRCRLRTTWSLLAKLAFCVVVALELLLIGLLGERFPGIKWILLSLPGLIWWLKLEGDNLQRLIAVLLDDVAGKMGLIKLETAPGQAEAAPPPTPAAPR